LKRLVVFGPGHPFRGGIATTTTALVRALQGLGHDVLFLTPVRQYPKWLYPGGDDRDLEACPRCEGARAAFAPMEPWTWRWALRAARAHRADAWIIPYWTWAWSPMWRAVLAARSRPTVVGVVHNPVDHEASWIKRWSAGSVLRRCDGLMTHGRVLADALRRSYPELPVVSHLLPPVGDVATVAASVDPEAVRGAIGVAAGERLAVFAGLIRPYKGVDLALRAVDALPGVAGWRLHVAGETWGELGKTLDAQHRTLDHPERITFERSWVSEQRLVELLAAADLVVLPYRSGSQSAMAPLAMAAGTPVLTTDVGGLAETVTDGHDGRVVRPASWQALAEALGTIDDAELVRLAAGARASAAERVWPSYATTLLQLLL
jgi:glycosyltransferase involved in cell wall biosynthesis